MANKISRTQEVTDESNGAIAKQTITGVHFSVSVNYNEELTFGKKTYEPRASSESISESFGVTSVEEFDAMVAKYPEIGSFLGKIFDKIKENYK